MLPLDYYDWLQAYSRSTVPVLELCFHSTAMFKEACSQEEYPYSQPCCRSTTTLSDSVLSREPSTYMTAVSKEELQGNPDFTALTEAEALSSLLATTYLW
jgi:hypothetical protein